DIEGVGSSLIVKFLTLRQRFHESFTIGICLYCFEISCPFVLPTSSKRLFCTTKQEDVVAASLARIPWENPTTLFACDGGDNTTIKRHAGWKSTTVAEGYVENSIENKTKIANQA
ncbi:hypothetical protein NQ317_010123, partial [Molorchus minor]